MIPRSCSKRTPEGWVMWRSRGQAIIQQGFARVLGSAVMADRDPADGFKITDRRRRDDDAEVAPAQAQAATDVRPAAEPPAAAAPPTRPSREPAVETP